EGTPQGSPLSPLLSNIVLDELDKELEKRGHAFVRYADDVSVYVSSEASAKRVMTGITKYIEEKLRLKVNREKTRAGEPEESNIIRVFFSQVKRQMDYQNSKKECCTYQGKTQSNYPTQ